MGPWAQTGPQAQGPAPRHEAELHGRCQNSPLPQMAQVPAKGSGRLKEGVLPPLHPHLAASHPQKTNTRNGAHAWAGSNTTERPSSPYRTDCAFLGETESRLYILQDAELRSKPGPPAS